ncbi:hypothetical protein SOCE836_070230 [Sorangium cellulosum]|uniref:EcxA zinc-binding domain-containing protein n=1 Tax=Sorangium cellulosum TaxID=56 RepID=A0A4P2QWK2_SORCE|nr:hypothetical protein SOCE836_070230 [Sorangium cellulosum]WCQ94152.1 hypothetical protein NQZ70_06909 [Sorangium sp. Soce836]
MSWIVRLALFAAAAGSIAGCAEERRPISQVQANALAKSFFVGADLQSKEDDPEFWTRTTVVDVGYGASQDGLFSSSYAQAEVARIKWVIQEDLLIGRLTYERVNDTDGKGAGAATDDGVVAVAYKILSHFDVQRDYNRSTGEETNVVVENTTDRPWYAREYMRVDWSKNLNVDSYDFDTLSLIGVYGGVQYEPLSYYVSDPSHPDAPHFDPEEGYFDVTNKAFAMPQLIDLSHLGVGIGSFPACMLDADFPGGTAPVGSCNPVEVTLRQSFRRVVDRDYEPAEWDGYRFQAFGPFVRERFGYARNYGMSDAKWHRMITRYNLWERSHYYADPERMTGEIRCFTPETTPVGADPHRDDDKNGTEDECEAVTGATMDVDGERVTVGPGSRCDTFKQRCTLPYQRREAVPQPWYVTSNSNPDYFDATASAAHEWDVALRSAVVTAKHVECVRTTGDAARCSAAFPVYDGQMDDSADAVALAREVDACRRDAARAGQGCDALADELGERRGYAPGVVALAKMPEMIVLCHSPVEAADPEACGGPRLPEGVTARMCSDERRKEAGRDPALMKACGAALSARIGDLRYHQINNFEAPQSPSAWGIYSDSEDPLTGEKIASSINVWTHVNDIWSQGIVDTARYIKGELKTEEVTDGDYVRDWAQASDGASKGGALPRLTREEIARRIAGAAGVTAEHAAEVSGQLARDPALRDDLRRLSKEVRAIAADATAPDSMRAVYEARRQSAVGTELEAELTTKTIQQLTGVEALPLTDEVMRFASPLRGANPSVQRELRNLREVALAERGACVMHEAPAPLATANLADILEEKFASKHGRFGEGDAAQELRRAEAMRRYLAQRAHYAVILHEMGHSVGLRHNFVSSSDAWGYRPQYWQLRTDNGRVKTPCETLSEDGESCVGPRYYDPVTENERKNLIWMFMHSSTMDYAGEPTQDLIGLGAYDFAAARMFYGDVVSVHADPSYRAGTPRGKGMLAKIDDFGGILGFQPEYDDEDIHYSDLQNKYELIRPGSCVEVDPSAYRPSGWDEEQGGAWHPVLDGHIVPVDGKYTRCRQQKVDYVSWRALETPKGVKGPSVDPAGRTRVPYGFASDRWADLGNLSVYRHDSGADAYELFNFFITQQEVNHIFDNYRRDRQAFSVRAASERTLNRYNAKMRDGAKGLGLAANIYREFALDRGYDFDTFWVHAAGSLFQQNILAAGIAFDHFALQMARPQPGEHFLPKGDTVLRSSSDVFGDPGDTVVVVPNGATGYFGDVAVGGKPLENALAEDKGEYDSSYTMNAGSYYDKAWVAMLMTESVDNFVSDSRHDFLDARYRAVSLADVFPEGYRRWLGNNLTGDDAIKGVRIEADDRGRPVRDASGYPASALGWTSWWSEAGPESCFPGAGSIVCSAYGAVDSAPWNPRAPAKVAILDPQIGWEQQKFLIAWTLLYLPENQKQRWLDMMHIWETGADTDPGFPNRIELHHPSGKVFVAKAYGTETVFGKVVQKGIGARVLEYANELLAKAYVTEPGPDLDGDGKADWHKVKLSPESGQPIVRWDPTVAAIAPDGEVLRDGVPGCEADSDADDDDFSDFYRCTCSSNRACVALEAYVSVPVFIRQALAAFKLGDPTMRGLH